MSLGLLVTLLTPACRRRGRPCPRGWGGPRSWPRAPVELTAFSVDVAVRLLTSAFSRAPTPLLQVVADPLAVAPGRQPGEAARGAHRHAEPACPAGGGVFLRSDRGRALGDPRCVGQGQELGCDGWPVAVRDGDPGPQCRGRLFLSAFSGAGGFAPSSSLVCGLRCGRAAGKGRGAPRALLSLKQPFRRPPPGSPAGTLRPVAFPPSGHVIPASALVLVLVVFCTCNTFPVSGTFRARGQLFRCSLRAVREQAVTGDREGVPRLGSVASVQRVRQDLASEPRAGEVTCLPACSLGSTQGAPGPAVEGSLQEARPWAGARKVLLSPGGGHIGLGPRPGPKLLGPAVVPSAMAFPFWSIPGCF